MNAILQFTGPHRFLSNFFIEPDGTFVEREYQAAKCVDPFEASALMALRTPVETKRAGRRVKLRADWEVVKLDVMRRLVTQKFADHPVLAQLLLNTGDAELVEGNWWKDTYWGVCNGRGENHLGKILMQIRAELA